jgi:hypothetical protein
VLSLIAAVAGVWAVVLWLTDGVHAEVWGVRLRSSDPLRPLILSVACVALATALRRHTGSRFPYARFITPVMVLLSITITAVGVHLSNGTASGADSFGYVSEAELWLGGKFDTEQPWVREAPWDNRTWTTAPLGYAPARGSTDGTITPNYSPGLPFMMAAAKRVAGQAAMFWIVPVFGGLMVFATYAIGRRVADAEVGAAAAVLTATSPAMLFMLVWPMTDVPIAALFALATWALLRESLAGTIVAGLITGVAIFVRPNMAIVGALLGAWVLWRAPRRALWFALACVPGVAAVAAFNAEVYGSPLRSGYGTVSEIFAWSNFGANVRNYTAALWTSQTPVMFLGLLPLLLPWRRIWGDAERARRAWTLTAVTAGTLACFLFYLAFDPWWYLRFLLPLFPGMFIGLAVLVKRLAGRHFAVASLVVIGGLSWYGLWFTRAEHVADLHRGERRYVLGAALVRTLTEPNSVVFSMQHSGSVRYYGERVTIRWDNFPQDQLVPSIAWLQSRGVRVYALLDDWEVPEFRQRFSGAGAVGRLDVATVAELVQPGHVWLFDLTAPPSMEWPRIDKSEDESPSRRVGPGARPTLVLR